MSGIARTIRTPPNANLPSNLFSLDWALVQLILDPNQRFGGIISSLLIQNRDVTNAITVRLNHGRPFTIAPNISIPFNDIWTDLVDITPNAGTGSGNLVGQFVPNDFLK